MAATASSVVLGELYLMSFIACSRSRFWSKYLPFPGNSHIRAAHYNGYPAFLGGIIVADSGAKARMADMPRAGGRWLDPR